MSKVKVEFLEDFDGEMKGKIILMSIEEAQWMVDNNKPVRIIDEEKEERARQAKYYSDKRKLETNNQAKRLTKNEAVAFLGVDPDNYDRIITELSPKEPSANLEPVEDESIGLKTSFLRFVKDKNIPEASEAIAKYILENRRIYTTKVDQRSEMWFYKEGIYVPHGESEIKELTRKILQEQYNQYYFNLVKAKIEADTFIEPDRFFITGKVDEVPIEQGIFNIFTRQIRPFNPDEIFFNKLPVRYNPDATCPMIDSFLTDIFPNDDDKKVFYEIGGYCLLKEYKFEKAFMLVGNGRNGKGKALELIRRIIDDKNCFSLSLSALKIENADVSQLFGKMVNLAGDISNTDLRDTGLFKSLTGRDSVTIKRKFLSALTFQNYAKFIFACNELPMVYDTSKGFWDRWVLLQFPYTFEDQETISTMADKTNIKLRDEDIIAKITTPEELAGLFNKFLDGLDRLIKNRKFSTTKGSEDIKKLWIRISNSFMAFCMDNIEESYEGKINKKDLRKRYSIYCKSHKLKSKSDVVIKRVLQEEFGASEERETDKDTYAQDWYWTGVKWK